MSNTKRGHKPDTKFHLSSTSGKPLPLLTVQQRILGLWESLTWPVFVKVLKANLALTLAMGLYFIDPIRHLTGTSGILAAVAVEFVHPSKSYGFLAEDVIFGSLMCCLSAAWSLLGIFLSSLVRNQSGAQPSVCAILFVFLIVGCFFLSIIRIKIEKANVGGMLAATIMVLSLTTAVQSEQFTVLPTALLSTLVGFFLIFLVFLVVFPENSTRVYVEQLIKILEVFDHTVQQQVHGFLKTQDANVDTVAMIHKKLDLLTSALIQKKRMARREPSYNVISPTDISELTALIKQIHVPLRGLGVTRAMENNMRYAEEKIQKEKNHADPASEKKIKRPQSFYGDTDEEEMAEITEDSEEESKEEPKEEPKAEPKFWEDSIKVMTYWKDDYDEVLNVVKPTYLHLTRACSEAIRQSIERLRRMQSIDPRYQNRPFVYKYYHQWKVGQKTDSYDPKHDPSLPLLKAIQDFHQHRLKGLERLYTSSGVPHRILFLLLTFQFNLHAFAKLLYTLTSLIYELDQCRTQRRFWWPHITLNKWLFQNHSTEEAFALETPAAIVDATHLSGIQKTLSRRATTIAAQAVSHRYHRLDIESQPKLYRLETPRRGQVRSASEHREAHIDMSNPWRQNALDPMDYHDPDVSYPNTRSQRFFYHLDLFLTQHLFTAETAFAVRAVIVVVLLSLPAFLESSVGWYAESRAQWAVVVALIWMGPSVGSNFFG